MWKLVAAALGGLLLGGVGGGVYMHQRMATARRRKQATAAGTAPPPLPHTKHEVRGNIVEKTGPIIVFLSGKRFCGKDTVANIILQELPTLKIESVAFADLCKLEYAEYAHIEAQQLFTDRDFKELHRVPMTRFYHQQVQSDPQHFTHVVKKKIETELQQYDMVIVRDGRRLDDIRTLKTVANATFLAVRIHAGDEVRKQRGWQPSEQQDQDATETELDSYVEWHSVVHNDSNSMTQLVATIRSQLLPAILDVRTNLKHAVSLCRFYENFPTANIFFNDCCTTMEDATVRSCILDHCCRLVPAHTTTVVGLDSRGYVFGAPLADRLGLRFVMARKQGKVPGPSADEDIESKNYGSGGHSVSLLSLTRTDRCLLVDDVVATGGSLVAVSKCVRATGATITGCLACGEFLAAGGRQRLQREQLPLHTLVQYSGTCTTDSLVSGSSAYGTWNVSVNPHA